MPMCSFQPTGEMQNAVLKLKEGEPLLYYRDKQALRLETEFGNDPWVWRWSTKSWRKMTRPKSFRKRGK